MRLSRPSARSAIGLSACLAIFLAAAALVRAQVESIPGGPQHYVWTSHAEVEGHLALATSPDAAFSPDSSTLAVVWKEKVMLLKMSAGGTRKLIQPHLPGLGELTIQSANFISPNILFLLGTGTVRKTHGRDETPLLGFRWNIKQDSLDGKVDTIGAQGGIGPVRYLPQVGFLGIYSNSTFQLWNPSTGQTMGTKIPELTRRPNVFTFSPDGHWLILAQIEGGGGDDPVVVQLSTHQFVNSLRGHQGTVMSIEFSRNSKKVVTACEDGKVRIYSVPDWKLLETLSGHQGPVHWAEFSPDGKLVASAGEDQTVRVWSVANGRLLQTLSESQQPLRTVAFSPDGQYIAATSEKTTQVWQRVATGD